LLKCFPVQCQEVLLQVLDLQLQCGNLPYQLISGLTKNISWIWWIYYSLVHSSMNGLCEIKVFFTKMPPWGLGSHWTR
jgi:hypothetical protein